MRLKIKLYQAYQQDETTHAVTSINKELLREVVSLCDQVTASNRYGLLDDFQGLDLVANENVRVCFCHSIFHE